MTNSITNALEDMRSTIENASLRLFDITESESESRRADGKWSTKEILGHLIDSAANNHARFVTAQFKNDLIFPGYEQEGWVATQRYQEESWNSLVTLWKFYNLHLFHVASSIPQDKLGQPRSDHSLDSIAWKLIVKGESTTLEYLVLDYIDHMKHHLRQIFGE